MGGRSGRRRLPIHLHTIGGGLPDFNKLEPKVQRAAFAAAISSFQMYMAIPLMSLIFAGVLEHHPQIRIVIGESGIGWIPYVLEHMDLEWEDQFKDLDLKMRPSELLAPAGICDLSDRSHRHQDDRRDRRG